MHALLVTVDLETAPWTRRPINNMQSFSATLAALAYLASVGLSYSTKAPRYDTAVSVPALWGGVGFFFNITVGTPPQSLTVLSDWTWVALFVRSGRCQDGYDPSLCDAAGQSYFNEKASGTFQNTSLPQLDWPVTAFSPYFTVDYGSDTVCVGKVCTPNTDFQLSDFPYNGSLVPAEPFGGIYGLAPVTAQVNSSFYTANYQAWKSGTLGPQVGWHACSALSSLTTCSGGDALFVFGGTDTAMYDTNDLEFYSVVGPSWLNSAFYPYTPPKDNYWSTAWTGSWVGNYPRNFVVNPLSFDGVSTVTPLVVLDEGSEGLGASLSLNAYNFLVSQLNGTLASNATVAAITKEGSSGPNTENQDWYLVNCNTTGYPTLTYELDGRANYTIPPSDYVQDLNDTDQCYLNALVWEYGKTADGNAAVAVLGLNFLKRLYVVLDFQQVAFGLAPLKI